MSVTLPLFRAAAMATIVALCAGAAHAVPVSAGSYANTGIGSEFASPYDNLFLTGHSLNVAVSAGSPVHLTLADYSFEVGPNCYACTQRPSFDALIDVTVGGITRQLDLAYTWSSTARSTRSLSRARRRSLRFRRQQLDQARDGRAGHALELGRSTAWTSRRHHDGDRRSRAVVVAADGRRSRRRRLGQAPAQPAGPRLITRSRIRRRHAGRRE